MTGEPQVFPVSNGLPEEQTYHLASTICDCICLANSIELVQIADRVPLQAETMQEGFTNRQSTPRGTMR